MSKYLYSARDLWDELSEQKEKHNLKEIECLKVEEFLQRLKQKEGTR